MNQTTSNAGFSRVFQFICASVAITGVAMTMWQIAFLCFAYLAGPRVGQLEWLVRGSAVSGGIAVLAAKNVWNPLRNVARKSLLMSIVALVLGVVACYVMLPRSFLAASF